MVHNQRLKLSVYGWREGVFQCSLWVVWRPYLVSWLSLELREVTMKAALGAVHGLFGVLCADFCVRIFVRGFFGTDFSVRIFFGADFLVRIFGADFSVRIFRCGFWRGFWCGFLGGFFSGFFFARRPQGKRQKKSSKKSIKKSSPKSSPKAPLQKSSPKSSPNPSHDIRSWSSLGLKGDVGAHRDAFVEVGSQSRRLLATGGSGWHRLAGWCWRPPSPPK